MTVLLVHPGARWSTADVEAGLRYGLEAHGVEVIRYRLDTRLTRAKSWLYASWRARKDATVARPTTREALLQAGVGVLEHALRHAVDAVVVVSAILVHPDVLVLLKRAGLKVVVVFTESPYDHVHEHRIAGLVDGGWTHERTAAAAFRAVTPCAYLPHAWHPERHFVSARSTGTLPAHDVVFVGSGFPERVTWFNAIDWAGIDLGLYGGWTDVGLKPQVAACVRGAQMDNATAAALYRRAKIGLNLYRRTKLPAESLNPRAYELAACGVFSLSEARAESHEKFGALVPTFTSPAEASALMRHWLHADDARAVIQRELPAAVAGDSWVTRAGQVLADLAGYQPAVTTAAIETPSDERLFDLPEAVTLPRTSIPTDAFPGQAWCQA